MRGHILKRDRYTCQLCGDFATHVDHVHAGDDNSEKNLRALCVACHSKKSSREGHEARVTKVRTHRAPEAHPAMLVQLASPGTG